MTKNKFLHIMRLGFHEVFHTSIICQSATDVIVPPSRKLNHSDDKVGQANRDLEF